jgi:hypothetical protein
MSEWRPIETAPERELVLTKIHDAAGERNKQTLIRDGRLWWTPGYVMYVYYAPTHWKPAPLERAQ